MKIYQRNKIQFKLTIQIFLLAVVPLIISGIVTYRVSSDIIENNLKKNAFNILEQVKINIDNDLTELEYVSNDIFFNQNLLNNIKEQNTADEAEKIRITNEMRDILTKILVTRRKIKSITILLNSGDHISTAYGILSDKAVQQDWYKKAKERYGKSFITVASPNSYRIQNSNISLDDNDTVMLSKLFKNVYSNETLGVLTVDTGYVLISDAVSGLSPEAEGVFFIADSEGKIIYNNKSDYHKESASYNKVLNRINQLSDGMVIDEIDGIKSIIINKTSNVSGWKYIEVIPYNKLLSSALMVKDLTTWLILICTLAALFFSIFVSRTLIKPLKELGKEMNKVEKGDLSVNVTPKTMDEVGQLEENFNNMINRLNEMQQAIYKEQEAKRQAELSALQAQINPHFLYNTLDSIKWMSVMQGNEGITQMIGALVSLLRNSINKGKEIITLRQEVQNVKNYIAIQKIRYFDAFQMEYDIDEAVLDFGIPKLVLQPLVENALFHGIENIQEGGIIKLSIRKEYEDIVCEVIDNGKGMSQDDLNGILHGDIKHRFTGISVMNVNERLKLNYGDKYGLTYTSIENVETKAIIKLPAIILEDKV